MASKMFKMLNVDGEYKFFEITVFLKGADIQRIKSAQRSVIFL